MWPEEAKRGVEVPEGGLELDMFALVISQLWMLVVMREEDRQERD